MLTLFMGGRKVVCMATKQETKKLGRPATGQTPKRYFRMGDEDWGQVVEASSTCDETASEYVRRVLLKDAQRVNRQAERGGVEPTRKKPDPSGSA